jgi:GNAT superfamily N-acetyltransferase
MVATRPLREDGAWEICRLYVDKAARGTGLAHRLLDAAEAHAREQGGVRLILWTDTRFEAAHAFYEKRGYVRQGAIRILDDLSKSLEFRYSKPAAGWWWRRWTPPPPPAPSAAWRRSWCAAWRAAPACPSCRRCRARSRYPSEARLDRVAQGKRLLLAAWMDGQLAGTVQLDLATPENQPHRAEVAKLLVDPAFRRPRRRRRPHAAGRAGGAAPRSPRAHAGHRRRRRG